MEIREYRTADKSTWGDGPWQNEPDKLQYQDEATGLPALIVRNGSGALCGYIGVPEGHPWFGKDYMDEDLCAVDVHGGLTFSGPCSPNGNEAEHICHVPAPGESDRVWWLGYDCAHSGDTSPAMDARMSRDEGGRDLVRRMREWSVYRDVAYVKEQNAELAQQVKAASGA